MPIRAEVDANKALHLAVSTIFQFQFGEATEDKYITLLSANGNNC
jgi:hypothetical protein